VARAKGLRLHSSAVPGLPVWVDAARVERALLNLVANAIRHTPIGGAVEVHAVRESGMATVSVSDSCGGIPAEHLPCVFDVGFRGETARTAATGEGAGLGLSIARGIIQAHRGQIGVANAGCGCQFVIRLPLSAEAVTPDGAGQHEGAAHTPPATVAGLLQG
jgi:signal transduction histidine kinase